MLPPKLVLIQALLRGISRHGFLGLLLLALTKIGDDLRYLRRYARAERRERQDRALKFDKINGVDTAGRLLQVQLAVDNPVQIHAAPYVASDEEHFREALQCLVIDHREYVFIDFGSGKGKALLLAAEWPFKKVLGLEICEQLHRVAMENIRRFPIEKCRCQDVASVLADVAAYDLPDDPLICYFYNPFDHVVMGQVLDNLVDSYKRKARDIVIIYNDPCCSWVIDQNSLFKKSDKIGPIQIWRSAII